MSTQPLTNPPPPVTAFALTDAGRARDQNEDAFACLVPDRLFVVADGMGGHNAGEVASQMAVDEIAAFFRSFHDDPRQEWPFPVNRDRSLGANLLTVGIQVANQKVRASAEEDRSRKRMACTVIAMAIGDSQLSIAHAGDARAYRLRGGEIKRLTRDHSILEEMIAARPDMKEEEIAAFSHRNVVTKAVGSKPEVDPTLYVGRFQKDDLFLLCSDGLWGSVKDQVIAEILHPMTDLEAACHLLIDAANDAGGPDNITVLLVRVDDAAGARRAMSDFLAEKRIVVCVGPGGVGKTTTAAALAALAAKRGQRTLVTTIDPAPRLADALGVALVAEPTEVPASVARALGIAPDKLHVARLDTERAFAKLVEEQVADPEMRRRIFENPIYRQITTTLTGSQEYAATLALYDIVRGNQFDLVVLDTPPTTNALDFLEAPRRLAEAIASPALQWFARPSADEGRFSLRRLRSGSAIILKRLAQFVGSQFLEDIAAFLSDFQGVLGGFLTRAESVAERLRGADVAFLLVLAPETPAVDEALFFERRLRQAGLHLEAFVANRVHERPGLTDVDELTQHLRARPALAGASEEDLERLAATLGRAAIDMSHVCDGEDRELARLRTAAPQITLLQVPRLDHDVASLAALSRVGGYLSPEGPPSTAAR